jgi:hypothetical protein
LPTVKLPAEGRRGEPPLWPFGEPGPSTARNWAELWSTPMAVMWERSGWHKTVARYVLALVSIETGAAQMAVWAEARQLEDRLGLNPLALMRLRWEVVSDEVGAARATRRPARRRLRAVDSGGAAAR